ncbi:hypothetical protein LASUN_13230 [Lentilactobacillus sunkii]|jgi:hypothetical protein|uniref:Uncharacterized protein n=1 Tax=Lentilactobacillus sunkii TaxID=481719 RepID=A0A1E7XCB7_9LACO|nr:hypothetical protein [Lentilactobacillus sunkii]OFA10773.1 hypothetical protein LASUN_13230 [Lentilactobacillus sunkii]
MTFMEFKQAIKKLSDEYFLYFNKGDLYVSANFDRNSWFLKVDQHDVGVFAINDEFSKLNRHNRLKLQKLAYRFSRTPIEQRASRNYGFQLDNGYYVKQFSITKDDVTGSPIHLEIDLSTIKLTHGDKRAMQLIEPFLKGHIVEADK